MRYVVAASDELLHYLLGDFINREVLFLVEDQALADRLSGLGRSVLEGRFSDPDLYRKALLSPEDLVILQQEEPKRIREILSAMEAAAVVFPLILVREGTEVDPGEFPRSTVLSLKKAINRLWYTEVRAAQIRRRVAEILVLLQPASRVLLLMQKDPDPDSIGSALALRELLGRTKATAPIATFGQVERLQNVAMLRLLDIDVETIRLADVKDFERVCLIDTQPGHFSVPPSRLDVVIDHHPLEPQTRAPFVDVKDQYGATTTILVEYLRAANTSVSQRLATALVYGIVSDTFFFERGVHQADIEAYSFLYPLANHGLLRRIDRPEIPPHDVAFVQKAIRELKIVERILFTHVGAVPRLDIIPRLADFCLQVEGVEWTVVSGISEGSLVTAVRYAGVARHAGSVVQEAFGGLGNAGGHRAMARATIPLAAIAARLGSVEEEAIRKMVMAAFISALEKGRGQGKGREE